MELKDILGNLNDDQIKNLKELLNSDSKSVVDYLQSREEEKAKQIQEQQERERIAIEDRKKREIEEEKIAAEKSKVQIANAEKNLSDLDKVRTDLKNLFNYVTSNNEEKDLVSKIHDRITAIVIEYVIAYTYERNILEMLECDYLDKLAEARKKHQELPESDSQFKKIRHFVIYRCIELEGQYRLLSYMYGKLLGLPDEQIINKGFSLKDYSGEALYSSLMDNGKSIIDTINDFYLDNYNGKRFYCVRNENNELSYPRSANPVIIPLNVSHNSEFKFSEEAHEKYFPFTDDRITQLFDEILRPYYEKNGGTYDFSQCGGMYVIDDYKADEDNKNYNHITFYNQSDYILTQQLVNEYLSQKETNKQL